MINIVSGTEMKKVDEYTIKKIGVPSIVLMERAAWSAAELIFANEPKSKSVLVAVGTGNNGADGLAVARMMFLKGYHTKIFILGNVEKATQEFKQQLKIIENLEVGITTEFVSSDIIVDAIFGVGLSRDVTGKFAEVIEQINKEKNIVYSLDIPSGIDADTAKVCNVAVRADYTVTFGAHKIGTVLYPGADYCGKVFVTDIGFPKTAFEKNESMYGIGTEELEWIPPRPNYSNKGNYGKILIVAGSRDISGAAYLCAKAALRTGAGLVRVFTANENRQVIQRLLPEAMVNTYDTEKPDLKALQACINWCDVVAIGPGLATGVWQKKMVETVLDSKITTVIDADGINNIAEEHRLKKKMHRKVIITPHLGEMSRLMAVSVDELKDNLIEYAKKSGYLYDVNCILKDARTVIATKENTFINLTGNNGMATAGSGDVLTGILAGLLGIGVDFEKATALAPFIHGMAGDMAAKKVGTASLMATDIIDELKNIVNKQ